MKKEFNYIKSIIKKITSDEKHIIVFLIDGSKIYINKNDVFVEDNEMKTRQKIYKIISGLGYKVKQPEKISITMELI